MCVCLIGLCVCEEILGCFLKNEQICTGREKERKRRQSQKEVNQIEGKPDKKLSNLRQVYAKPSPNGELTAAGSVEFWNDEHTHENSQLTSARQPKNFVCLSQSDVGGRDGL